MGKGENGGRERGEQKQQNRKEKEKKRGGEEKTVRLACFFLLYHLFSVSRGGPQLLRHMEHKKPDKRVLADGEQSGQEAGDSSNAGSASSPL